MLGKQPAQGGFNSKIQDLKADVKGLSSRDVSQRSDSDQSLDLPDLGKQLQLLGTHDNTEIPSAGGFVKNDIENAVIFSGRVQTQYGSGLLPQYALLGSTTNSMEVQGADSDPRVLLNTNIPFSAFICGLQGSGKSHTMSCILENSLIASESLGSLQKPLSAMVFHFGQYTSRLNFRPCEAAFLARPHPRYRNHPRVASINILVAPSNYQNLHASYTKIPGVTVRPLKLRSKDLNISSMMTLMSVDQTQAIPLYMGRIRKILRDIAATSNGNFKYAEFKAAMESCNFSAAQKGPLQQRLELLESFLDLDDTTPDHNFEAGSITIVDLSCPFVDSNTACILFNICMGLYLESDITTGKVIAVDEAHKYITDTPASIVLTESLLTVIRQQRHYGARVIISTQEPTISPRLMDLSSILVVHRFSSPAWFDVIRKHVSIGDKDKTSLEALFRRITNLGIGEALLFAPSGILSRREDGEDVLYRLSSSLLKVQMRNRLTWDGGKSVVCL